MVSTPAGSTLRSRKAPVSPLTLVRDPEVRFLALVGIPEGAAVFGYIVFFAPALEHLGFSASIAALATGVVGLGMLMGGILVRRVGTRVNARVLLALGAAILTCGYLFGLDISLANLFVGAFLVGFGQSGVHSTLQRRAADAAPRARAVGTAMFATGVFVGAGLATLSGAIFSGAYRWDFGLAALCGFASAVAVLRHRQPPGRAEAASIESGPGFDQTKPPRRL
jgi:MFS family permease